MLGSHAKYSFAHIVASIGLIGMICCLSAVPAFAQATIENDLPPRPLVPPSKKKLKFDKNGGVVYQKTASYELKCDVYVPEGEGPFPAILAVHGGAWRAGSKFALLRHAWRMAQNGYVVVAINYRHAPEYPFPAQIHDCKHAVRWMRANAKTYKIDSTRIGAFGYSAGGHLVTLLGTTAPTDGLEGNPSEEYQQFSTQICAVAAGGAPCEFSWVSPNSNVLAYWLGGSKTEKPNAYLKASPIEYVTPDDPPFFLFHGSSDLIVPSSSSLKFQNALNKKGVKNSRHVAESSGHLGTFSDISWMDKAIEFFDRTVKEKSGK